MAVEVTSGSDARGLLSAALSPVLDAWRMTQGIPVMSAASVLETAASVGLVPQSGFAACCYSRHALQLRMLCVHVGHPVHGSRSSQHWLYAKMCPSDRLAQWSFACKSAQPAVIWTL